MNVTVVGGGKMGLPLACLFARNGATVIVADVRTETVAAINAGRCPIDEPDVPELVAALVAAGRLSATTDTPAAVAQSDVVVVIVPVLLTPDNDADTSIIESVSRQIAGAMRPGAMIVYETTLPIGRTRELGTILATSGRTAGVDFDLVFSPERVKSQFVLARLTENLKVVGGVTPQSASRAETFYRTYLRAPVRNVGTLEAAEMVKLAGMVYRDANIGLANEMARYAEAAGVDLSTIVDAINSDGEAAMLQPGIGVGGHCAPVYPYFYIHDAQRRGLTAGMAVLGRELNDGQAAWALDRVERAGFPLRGSDLLILGLGYRPQVKEHICSTAFLLQAGAVERGARVMLDDPLYTDAEIRAHGFEPLALAAARLPAVVILNTAHAAYRDVSFADLAQRGVRIIVDGRAVWPSQGVEQAGIVYLRVGRPARSVAEAQV